MRSAPSASIATSSPTSSPARFNVSTGSVTWFLLDIRGIPLLYRKVDRERKPVVPPPDVYGSARQVALVLSSRPGTSAAGVRRVSASIPTRTTYGGQLYAQTSQLRQHHRHARARLRDERRGAGREPLPDQLDQADQPEGAQETQGQRGQSRSKRRKRRKWGNGRNRSAGPRGQRRASG